MSSSTAEYEQKIRDLEDDVRRIATNANAAASRYAAALAEERAVTARLRAALADAATDAAQADALAQAASIVGHESSGACYGGTVTNLACALLAIHEEHKVTRGRLDALTAGIERAMAGAREELAK